MQTFSRVTWIIVSVLALLLPVLFFSGFISWGFLIINGLLAIVLAAAAVSTTLLKNASGILKYAGLSCAWGGFLVLGLALHHFIELKNTWPTGFFLISAGLICGIFSIQKNAGKRLKLAGIAASILLIPVITGILAGIESAFFYQFGTIVLIVFSITALFASIQPSKRR